MKRARDEEKSHVDAKKCQKRSEADNILYASIRTIVNASKKEKKRALYRATEEGHAKFAKVLIQNGLRFTRQLGMDMLTLRKC